MADSGDPQSAGVPAPAIPSAERERIIDTLTRHFAEDQLSEADLEARLDRVYGAVTLEELRAVVADLPELPGEGGRSPVPAATAGPGSLAGPPRRITSLLSGHEQSFTGTMPRRLTVRARLGYVELDLRRAIFEPGLNEIDVRAFMGYVQLLLPGNVRVESDGHGLFGNFTIRGSGSGEADDLRVVRITGRALFGFADCLISRKEASGSAGEDSLGPEERDAQRLPPGDDGESTKS